jgi:hypothetical protein
MTFLPLVDCQNVTGRSGCGRSPAVPINLSQPYRGEPSICCSLPCIRQCICKHVCSQSLRPAKDAAQQAAARALRGRKVRDYRLSMTRNEHFTGIIHYPSARNGKSRKAAVSAGKFQGAKSGAPECVRGIQVYGIGRSGRMSAVKTKSAMPFVPEERRLDVSNEAVQACLGNDLHRNTTPL